MDDVAEQGVIYKDRIARAGQSAQKLEDTLLVAQKTGAEVRPGDILVYLAGNAGRLSRLCQGDTADR